MRHLARLTLVVLATATVVLAVLAMRQAVLALLLSLATAAAVQPVVAFYTSRGAPRPVALGLTYGVGLLGAVLVVSVTAGSLLVDLQETIEALTAAYDGARDRMAAGSTLQRVVAARLPGADLVGVLAGGSLARGALGFTMNAIEVVAELTIVLILSLFWSANAGGFERLWLSLLPVPVRAGARDTWLAMKRGVGEQIRSDLVQSLLAVVLLLGGFEAMGLSHPMLPAAAGGLLRLVPLVGVPGAVLTTILTAAMDGPVLTAAAAVYMVAVLVVLDRVVTNRLLRARPYSHLLTMLVIVALSDAFGLAGLVIAPAVATAVQIFFEKLHGLANPVGPATGGPLEARVEALGVLVAARGPAAPPELLSVVDRLGRLVTSVKEAGVELPAPEEPAHAP